MAFTPTVKGAVLAKHVDPNDYIAVGASATVVLGSGASGVNAAKGNFLRRLIIIPGSTSPGAVSILDGVTTIFTFPGGASSVPSVVPFSIEINAYAQNANGWSVTTGAGVTALAVGIFT